MKIVVAGYGKFGRLAVSRLLEVPNIEEILVLDPACPDYPDPGHGNVQFERVDAVRYLSLISEENGAMVIIPTVPFHLAAAYLLSVSGSLESRPIPDELTDGLPNVYRVNRLNVCCSYADFLCPDDCPENDECTVTGEIRQPMFERLEGLSTRNLPLLVIRSRQIMPGIGGFDFSELRRLVERTAGLDEFILATACRCHAILTGFRCHSR